MSCTVAIIDYQMGNLRSVQKAIESVGGTAIVTDQPTSIKSADKVILPGVGSFGDAMNELKRRDLVSVIQDVASSDKPFLGICLGLQLLFESGEENGLQPGLGILAGSVRRFNIAPELKVPHMGWNSVTSRQSNDPLMQGIAEQPFFYFVHSYFCQPKDQADLWLTSDYGGEFCAAIRRSNLFATQFHPEKSQTNGLKLLKNFLLL